jgi:flagellar basal-body rod protein FlgC
MGSFFDSMDVAASGMNAQRFAMDVIASNIANVNTVNQVSGEPYRRKFAHFAPDASKVFALPVGFSEFPEEFSIGGGVKIEGAYEDNSEDAFKYEYDPTNPRAEKDGKWKGYVKKPNINIIQEMTNLIVASRAYEANATVVQAAKQMAQKGATIGK